MNPAGSSVRPHHLTEAILIDRTKSNMIVSDEHQTDIESIVRAGPSGAIVLAGIATAIVFALWFAFYFLVFLPRGVIQ
ncbi:hypothetical protein [Paraburkholderia rhizosphaerae]|uniref:Cytochrome c oxidase subunit IIa family protein n=2 Tax=Paraburkholderia rhizosphaerae TaxID=480658 RepID=A0A4R8KPY7_9BURK|nr:hypothetical protein [Paraburkholderia rhizosphaerae]TDY31240.1 hypothetical protein BX592_1553 [Paraburkholderia rhizosphaerae]